MKKLLLPFLLLLCIQAFSQKFYVSGKDDRSVRHVVEKIKFEGYETVTDSLKSDYVVQLLIDGEYKVVSFKRAYQGYIRIIKTSTGDEIARSKIVKRNPAALNGYNAAFDIFSTICKRYLVNELKKCKY